MSTVGIDDLNTREGVENSRWVQGAPHASIARAELKDSDDLREFIVLLKRPSLRDAPEEVIGSPELSSREREEAHYELCIVADYLLEHLIVNNVVAGILPCLGYRNRPHVELVF